MPVDDPTVKSDLSRALANTYQTKSDATSWELCQQYQQVLAYAAEHPDAGRVRVANAVFDGEVPASRVRLWLDGGRPPAMRAVEICDTHGWLDLEWGGHTLRNLTVAIAWVFSGGSITADWVPYLTVTSDTRSCAERVFDVLGVASETVRAAVDNRATEVRPTEAAAPLGRLLTVLGAPQGTKHPQREFSLPPWLAQASHAVQLAFARTYVMNRGTSRPDRPETPIQLMEARSDAYRRALASFFDAVAGEPVTQVNQHAIMLMSAGTHLFDAQPALPDS